MTIKEASTYLNFDGDASAAVELYVSALGAEVTHTMHFGDMDGHPFGTAADRRIMNAELKLGDACLRLSDVPPGHDLARGNASSVNLLFDDLDQLKAAYEKLQVGGVVGMALHEAFWGDHFAHVFDRFGVSWMLRCPITR